MHTTHTFDKICEALRFGPRFIDNRGGARSGKTVWADCAEPKSIEEIAGYGLNVEGCDKRTTVREQIQALQAWTIYVTRRSVELLNEGRKYLFKQRPDGTYTNEPIEFFNHGIDALRYAVYTGIITEGQVGNYTIGFRKKPVPRNPVKRKPFVNESEIINAHKQRNHR